jgi:predicted RNA binding protein YcfA (HicA-like mRNA interferase family)
MPPKVRDLIKKLKKEGFEERGGKGSHRIFKHPSGVRVTLGGNPGNDAKPYQELDVKKGLEEVRE